VLNPLRLYHQVRALHYLELARVWDRRARQVRSQARHPSLRRDPVTRANLSHQADMYAATAARFYRFHKKHALASGLPPAPL